jgi:type VI secretion system secreted protein Hcp
MGTMQRVVTALALAVGVTAVTPAIADDVFLRIDGIPGDSKDTLHAGFIDVGSFKWTVTNTAGGPTAKDFVFTHVVDRSSPKLALAAATGDHIPSVTLKLRTSARQPADYLTLTLKSVVVISVKGSDESSPTARFSEEVELSFTSFEYEYRAVRPDGSLDAPVRVTYVPGQRS